MAPGARLLTPNDVAMAIRSGQVVVTRAPVNPRLIRQQQQPTLLPAHLRGTTLNTTAGPITIPAGYTLIQDPFVGALNTAAFQTPRLIATNGATATAAPTQFLVTTAAGQTLTATAATPTSQPSPGSAAGATQQAASLQ